MTLTLQHPYMIGKNNSLVLNSHQGHHGDMTSHEKTTRNRRIRTFLRYAWGDSVAAHRALLRVPPYDDYLFNHRDER
jgi:hypothetical protein